MFQKARLRLTGWYLLILMTVSIGFSAVIYRSATLDLMRFAQAQRSRYERMFYMQSPFVVEAELIDEIKKIMAIRLGMINLVIMGVSGILGYYLSGKTLSPIGKMLEEQERFVSDASHELKTPITALKTTLEVSLRDKELGIKEAKETLATSLEEVNRLQYLSEGLLELSQRNVAGKKELIHIIDLIDSAVKTVLPVAKNKKIEIVIKKVLQKKVYVDAMGMVRVITAVLDNAVKYSATKSKIEVDTKLIANKILIIITDHGEGIEDIALNRVFDRFYRADISRHTQGYGLGLSIAKEIITNNGGNIEIDSAKDIGTKVKISIPYSAINQKKKVI